MESGIRNQESWVKKKIIHNSLFIIRNSRGFSLIEALLSVAVFALIVTAITGGLIFGQQSTALAGMRSRAAMLANEGLEAARNIRDENYNNLANGTYGLAVLSNQWAFSGSQDTTDIFTRQITIADAVTNRKQVTSTVNWQQNPQRSGTVTLVTYLTNWKATGGGGPEPTPTPTPGPSPTPTPSTCNEYCISIGYSQGTCRKGVSKCTANGETNEPGGNPLCIQEEGGTCCCAP